MGYSEVLCHICGVSFNIGRVRRPDEPREAGWSRFGPPGFVDGHARDDCHRDSGCQLVFRPRDGRPLAYVSDSHGRRILTFAGTDRPMEAEPTDSPRWGTEVVFADVDMDGDSDYVDHASEEEEPLEYDSDAEMELDANDGSVAIEEQLKQQADDGSNDWIRNFWRRALLDDPEAREVLLSGEHSSRYAPWYRTGLRTMLNCGRGQCSDGKEDFFPLFYPTDGDDASEHGSDSSYTPSGHEPSSHEEGMNRLHHYLYGKRGHLESDASDIEHIAGPECANNAGYSGYKISVEEMRGCLTSQCLVRKPPGWKNETEAEDDDEPFEIDGEFFLSGLSDYMPSRDMDSPNVMPARHGCFTPYAENVLWDETQADQYAMPFHPSCLEVYKRASQLQTGKVDMEGLTSWWTLEADYNFFHEFTQHVDVERCRGQDWAHLRGTEYLVANPLFIPALPAVMGSAVVSDVAFDPHQGAFEVPDVHMLDSSSPTKDPFERLPYELSVQVLSHLSSRDIANLRLSTRSFRQLPVSFFHELIMREMPWLWEAWPDRRALPPYAYWATTTKRDFAKSLEEEEYALAALDEYIRIVSSEIPELRDFLTEARNRQAEQIRQSGVSARKAFAPFHLASTGTNWYRLYTLITRHWSELKGLRNRQRIWQNCSAILSRIDLYRGRGDIPITASLSDVVVANRTR